MRAKEVLKSVRRTASPDYTFRSVKGTTPFETPSDAKLVESMLHNKNIRLPFMVGLYMDRDHTLEQRERVGLLYSMALLMNIDKAIDASLDFAQPLGKRELVTQLSNQPVAGTDVTIAELTERTLEHFSEPKQAIITDFFDAYVDIHVNRGRMYVGEYSYDDALAYRKATDNLWIETTAKLVDPSVDQQRIEKYQRFGMLAQHVDDVWDCFEDAQEGSQNLFLGLAGDMAFEYPEEIAALQQYTATPEDMRPKKSVKSWLRGNMPHVRAAYAEKYRELLTQATGLTRTIFTSAKATI